MVDVGEYATVRLALMKDTLEYLRALKSGGRVSHTIWPPHCKIMTRGHNVVDPVVEAVLNGKGKM